MAWGLRGGGFVGNASAKPGGSTLTTAPLSTNFPQVGDVVTVWLAKDNGATTGGATNEWIAVTDTGGNTYTKTCEWSNAQGAAAAGAVVAVFWSKITTALTSSSTLTATNGGAGIGALVLNSYVFTCGAGATVAVAATTNNAAVAGGNPPVLTLAGLPSREYLFIQACASETTTGAFRVAGSGWTDATGRIATSGGSATTNIGLGTGYQILTGTGVSTSWNALTADHAEVLVAFTETVTGPAAQAVTGAVVTSTSVVYSPQTVSAGAPADTFNIARSLSAGNRARLRR